ncbi:MAG TPA: O-antigen ligase family protein, partial [Elusimicrobiota bacterium]|nr:O-antigen ligase family protein [Elusimicrobiota bacterium]
IVLLLTQSRGPWLGALLGLFLIAVFHPKRLWLTPPMLLLAAMMFLSPALSSRAATLTEKHTDQSTVTRVVLWQDGLYVAKRHWLSGAGPDQLRNATERYRTEKKFPPNPYGFESDMHNQYLQHLAERGVIGLAALLWLMGVPLWKSWAVYRRERKDLPGNTEGAAVSLALLACFSSFFVVNLTERAFDDAEVALVFWLMAALTASKTEEKIPAAQHFPVEPQNS